jgi:CheY-like chemotaxis protein
MVTAYGREEVLKQADENAFANVLIKPVTPSMLFDSVLEVLGEGQERVYDAPSGASSEIARLRGAKVLLVEDNQLNREVAMGLLEDAHLSIDQAENGEVAVRMVSENAYDLVMMDMQMPVMDGITATKVIRSNPKFLTLPIIAMTANVMATDREKCIEAGMNDHVSKPIDPDELFASMLRWIKPRDSSSPPTEVASVVPSSPALAKLTDSGVLEISGIDTKAALRRTGGNQKRYESLLRKFAEPSAAGVREIRAALAAGDLETAARAAHSLKGAAANLGATAVAEVAAKAETAIANGNGVDDVLNSLASTFEAAVAAIRSALPSETVAAVGADANGDPASVREPLNQLKTLLKNDDGDAADFIIDARPVLSKVLTDAEMNNLSDTVGNFDFGAALNSLSAIATRLSLKLE